jgi:hypothetical protein
VYVYTSSRLGESPNRTTSGSGGSCHGRGHLQNPGRLLRGSARSRAAASRSRDLTAAEERRLPRLQATRGETAVAQEALALVADGVPQKRIAAALGWSEASTSRLLSAHRARAGRQASGLGRTAANLN